MKLINVYDWQPKAQAINILYDWLKERSEEEDDYVNISHRKLPLYGDHVKFFTERPYRFWEFITAIDLADKDCPLGYVSAGFDNTIGIMLARKYRGRGFGPQALQLFLETHEPNKAVPSIRPGSWIANINPKNERSIAVFGKAGFTHLQNTYILERA